CARERAYGNYPYYAMDYW
nr:immunoglobulin heavy chain junction region [Mus musculus]